MWCVDSEVSPPPPESWRGGVREETFSEGVSGAAWLETVYWGENVVWSAGYFVSTVGIDEAKNLLYVRWQGRQDSGQAKLEL
jgi:hypothetical protein